MKLVSKIFPSIKISLITFISLFLLLSCGNDAIINSNDYKILNNIVPLINETYENRHLLVDAKITEEEFWKILIETYEKGC